jgi:NADPH2:quinone reductase
VFSMKAVVCTVYGPPEQLVLQEVDPLSPGKDQVVISVKACGVNFPDTLIIQGKYQAKPSLPFTPGSDVAGIVKTVGEDVTNVHVGTRVMGFASIGGFAEEVICEARNLIPLPDEVDFTTAAAFSMAYGTSYHALKDRAQISPGEKLLVLGAAGGVGLAAIELAKIMGAHVIAAASTEEKLEICRQHGADEGINYTTEDLKERIKTLTNGNGVDVIYDPVGGPYTEPALRGMAWNGRYLVIGFTAGEIPRIPLNLPLLKGCSIVGVFWGNFTVRESKRNQENLQDLLSWLASGKIKPYISATYPLSGVADALNDIIHRKATGKIVIVTEA